jgi:hypothetical protein
MAVLPGAAGLVRQRQGGQAGRELGVAGIAVAQAGGLVQRRERPAQKP